MYNIQRGPDLGPHEHQDPDQKQEPMDNSKVSQSTTKGNDHYEDSMEFQSATPKYFSYSSNSYWQTQDTPKVNARSSYSGAEQQSPIAERPWECKVIGCAADVQTWVAESGLKRHQKMWHGPHACEIMGCPRGAPNGFGSATELQQHKSNEHYLKTGSSSRYADNLVDAVANITLQSGHEIDNEGTQTRVIKGNPKDNSETFDPHYRIHRAWEFKFGRVFKVLWSEPRVEDRGGTQISQRVGKWGQMFTEKVRRFVIIDSRRGHCICLPIMTYGGQGCLKKGVHAEDHAIIYTSSEPVRYQGEGGMTKKPIKVKTYSPQHKLEPASRLNYAKVYTIEYNVKVWFIGEIHKDSEWWFTTDYNETHPLLRPRGNPPSFQSQGLLTPPTSYGRSLYQPQVAGASSSSTQMNSWAGGSQYASVPQINSFSLECPTSTRGTTQAPDYYRPDPDALPASDYSPSWQTYQESTQTGSYSRRDDSNPGEYQSTRSTLTPNNLDHDLYGA